MASTAVRSEVDQRVRHRHEQGLVVPGGGEPAVVVEAPRAVGLQGAADEDHDRERDRGEEQHRGRQRRDVASPGPPGARRRPGGHAVRGGPQPGRDAEQGDHHDELDQRQGGRGAQVEERGGEQVDLGLDRGVPDPAQGQHHPERGRAEEEDDAGRADDRGPQRRAG